MGAASDTEKICDWVISGSAVSALAEWSYFIPDIHKRRELSTWACLYLVDGDTCFGAIYKPIEDSEVSLLRALIAHDGHRNVRQLIASYIFKKMHMRVKAFVK